MAFDASDDPVGYLADATDDEVLDGMRAAAARCLAAGITTVRDLGDRGYLALRLREELAASPASGSQVLAAGPPITTPRGHCWFLGGQADGVDAVRAAVGDRAEGGVDVIKVMASGGQLTPGTHSHSVQYGLDELRAAVEEAHRHGLPITAHAHATAAIANAVAAGFDMIEHCSFITVDGVDAPQDLIDSIARAGIIYPDMNPYHGQARSTIGAGSLIDRDETLQDRPRGATPGPVPVPEVLPGCVVCTR